VEKTYLVRREKRAGGICKGVWGGGGQSHNQKTPSRTEKSVWGGGGLQWLEGKNRNTKERGCPQKGEVPQGKLKLRTVGREGGRKEVKGTKGGGRGRGPNVWGRAGTMKNVNIRSKRAGENSLCSGEGTSDLKTWVFRNQEEKRGV